MKNSQKLIYFFNIMFIILLLNKSDTMSSLPNDFVSPNDTHHNFITNVNDAKKALADAQQALDNAKQELDNAEKAKETYLNDWLSWTTSK